jgi:sulfhydrogenase subunit gamma (sulfur reductase)
MKVIVSARGGPENNQGDLYLPHLAVIRQIIDETGDTETFCLGFKDERHQREFTFRPGQFAMASVLGVGEAPFCISSSPSRRDGLEITVRRAGRVTGALHRLGPGAEIGVRGPYGTGFPLDFLEGKDLVFIAGGIGLAALRALLWYVLENPDRYGRMSLVYGARRPADLCFARDREAWGKNNTLDTVITVDKGEGGWKGREGFVPRVLEEVAPSAGNAVALVCGPPVMNRLTFPVLEKLGFVPERIFTTLEKKMKCGVGKCGRCNIGNLYVCSDGPVFSYRQIKDFISQEY